MLGLPPVAGTVIELWTMQAEVSLIMVDAASSLVPDSDLAFT